MKIHAAHVLAVGLVPLLLSNGRTQPASSSTTIKLEQKTYSQEWSRGGVVKKRIEFRYTPTISYDAGKLKVWFTAQVIRHKNAFWSVTGEMDFADADWPVDRVELVYADGKTESRKGKFFKTGATLEFPAGRAAKLRLHRTLVGQSWTLEWDARPPSERVTLTWLRSENGCMTDAASVVVGDTVQLQATFGAPPKSDTYTVALAGGKPKSLVVRRSTHDRRIYLSDVIRLEASK